ncbi:MAG: hypothetical protein V2J51_11655 [Erythrobacter sp.]|nr:hypothetical protein [Erythrobacter sp.]
MNDGVRAPLVLVPRSAARKGSGLGAQYGLDDVTAGEELLAFGGRSFDALSESLRTSPSPCGFVDILHGCEYVGFDDGEVEPVLLDASLVEQEATKVIASLRGHDADLRVGAFPISEWIAMFERLRCHARDHPDRRFRPQYAE